MVKTGYPDSRPGPLDTSQNPPAPAPRHSVRRGSDSAAAASALFPRFHQGQPRLLVSVAGEPQTTQKPKGTSGKKHSHFLHRAPRLGKLHDLLRVRSRNSPLSNCAAKRRAEARSPGAPTTSPHLRRLGAEVGGPLCARGL